MISQTQHLQSVYGTCYDGHRLGPADQPLGLTYPHLVERASPTPTWVRPLGGDCVDVVGYAQRIRRVEHLPVARHRRLWNDCLIDS